MRKILFERSFEHQGHGDRTPWCLRGDHLRGVVSRLHPQTSFGKYFLSGVLSIKDIVILPPGVSVVIISKVLGPGCILENYAETYL